MSTFVTLVSWTDQGIRAVKESPQRLEAVKQAFTAVGGRVTQILVTMGDYDLVVVSEAPNDEAYASTMLMLASRGAVRTKTLKAFSEDDFRRIVANIS
jgi:uncharacterized protein with GYD domain